MPNGNAVEMFIFFVGCKSIENLTGEIVSGIDDEKAIEILLFARWLTTVRRNRCTQCSYRIETTQETVRPEHLHITYYFIQNLISNSRNARIFFVYFFRNPTSMAKQVDPVLFADWIALDQIL